MAEYSVLVNGEDLQGFFQAATEFVRTLKNISDEQKLMFYGLFKQAKEGACTRSRPGFWDPVGIAKWDSWKRLGHMPQQKALECYIQELSEIDPEWEEKYAVTDDLTLKDAKKPAQKQTMGLAVSTLRGQENHEDEIISDANKSVFNWCKKGNVKKLDFLQTREGSVNTKDDQSLGHKANAAGDFFPCAAILSATGSMEKGDVKPRKVPTV